MIEEIKLSSLVTLLILGAMFLGGSSIRLMILFLNKNSLYLQILYGGLLTGMFAFELLPEVFSHFQTIGILTGISIGIFTMITMEIFLHNKIAGKVNIFKKELTVDGQIYYSFRLNNIMIRKSISHPNAKTILFHFSDENCQDFIGIDILDIKSYSEQYLIGK